MQSGYTFLCCLAIGMWVVSNPSPNIAAERRREDASQSLLSIEPSRGGRDRQALGTTDSRGGSFNFSLPDAAAPRVAAPPLMSARGLDLELISRVAGCELAFALPPPLTTLQPCLPPLPLLTCSASRRPASALCHVNAHQAAM